MSINKENFRLWVQALRSGKYPQGRSRLKTLNPDGSVQGYCCLGVACEVALEHGVAIMQRSLPLGNSGYGVKFDGGYSVLPPAVISWLGLHPEDNDPIVAQVPLRLAIENDEVTAITANDGLDWDFHRIAQAIETHYELREGDDDNGTESGTNPVVG